jgi:hypothetical protein
MSSARFHILTYCAQGEVTLTARTKVLVNFLESKKIGFATSPRQHSAKVLTKLTLKKRGV